MTTPRVGWKWNVYMEKYLDISRTRNIRGYWNRKLCFSDDSDVTMKYWGLL